MVEPDCGNAGKRMGSRIIFILLEYLRYIPVGLGY